MDRNEIMEILRSRFEKNTHRHDGIKWIDVEAKLKCSEQAVDALSAMETTGGEPDVVMFDEQRGVYVFMDCSPESPQGRRSLCYDERALNSRKNNKPTGSAEGMAAQMGIEILDEAQYRYLQTLDSFDLKTSSWIKTTDLVRELGGALFCDRRYNTVFLYHNGAESYYASRGFRGSLCV